MSRIAGTCAACGAPLAVADDALAHGAACPCGAATVSAEFFRVNATDEQRARHDLYGRRSGLVDVLPKSKCGAGSAPDATTHPASEVPHGSQDGTRRG